MSTTEQKRLIPKPFSLGIIPFLLPVLAAVLVYQLDTFDPAHLPTHEFTRKHVHVPKKNLNLLLRSEKVGTGKLLGPEDIVHDKGLGVVYTGCMDGWIKRVEVSETGLDSVVEDWVNTDGRPLGLALGRDSQLIVADANKVN